MLLNRSDTCFNGANSLQLCVSDRNARMTTCSLSRSCSDAYSSASPSCCTAIETNFLSFRSDSENIPSTSPYPTLVVATRATSKLSRTSYIWTIFSTVLYLCRCFETSSAEIASRSFSDSSSSVLSILSSVSETIATTWSLTLISSFAYMLVSVWVFVSLSMRGMWTVASCR